MITNKIYEEDATKISGKKKLKKNEE